jgi:hypothetical protein
MFRRVFGDPDPDFGTLEPRGALQRSILDAVRAGVAFRGGHGLYMLGAALAPGAYRNDLAAAFPEASRV